jgi:hypothetical protein
MPRSHRSTRGPGSLAGCGALLTLLLALLLGVVVIANLVVLLYLMYSPH